MVTNFIFIEEGSVDAENLRKMVENCGDAKIITYRQGATKPELVSIENNNLENNIKGIEDRTMNRMISLLYDFLHEEKIHIEYDTSAFDAGAGRCAYQDVATMIYQGDRECFMTDFEAYINKNKDRDN